VEHNNSFLDRLEHVEERSAKHDDDLYYGDGQRNPSITMRLLLLEDIVAKIARNLNKITWLLVGGLVTGLITVVIEAVKNLK
jgi:hypothetical protein